MLSYLILAFVSYLVYTVANKIISLRRNIALAKSWGLPYVVLRKAQSRNNLKPYTNVLQAFKEIGVARSALIGIFLLPFLKLFPFTDEWMWPKYAHQYIEHCSGPF
jgi:hypothetical protein